MDCNPPAAVGNELKLFGYVTAGLELPNLGPTTTRNCRLTPLEIDAEETSSRSVLDVEESERSADDGGVL